MHFVAYALVNRVPLPLCILSLASGAYAANSPPTHGVMFDVVGTVLDQKNPDKLVRVEWERKPRASDFPNVDWTKITHEATVSANCEPSSGGQLTHCEVVEELPVKPVQRSILKRALALLRIQPSMLAQLGHQNRVLVGVRLINPTGTEPEKSYCGGLFCTTVPPPPSPRRTTEI